MDNRDKEVQPSPKPSRRNFLKSVGLSTFAALLPAGLKAETLPPEPEPQEGLKLPAIIGFVFRQKPDGSIIPFEDFSVALSREGEPRPNPNEREFFPMVEAATDENGMFVLDRTDSGEKIKPGGYILGAAREKGARLERKAVGPDGFNKPITISEGTTVIPGGVSIITDNETPLTPPTVPPKAGTIL